MTAVLDVSRFDSFRTIAWRSSRYLLDQTCGPHDPGARPGAPGVLAAAQAWLECGSALDCVSAGWCVAAYLKYLLGKGAAEREERVWPGQASIRGVQ